MDFAQSLSDILAVDHDNSASAIIEASNHGYFTNRSYLFFLQNTYIDKDLPPKPFDIKLLALVNEDIGYVELIDIIVVHLISENSQNVLINGYHDPADNAAWSSNIYNPFVNFNVNCLKGKFWKRFYYEIGKEKFLSLVTNSKCYTKNESGTLFQLFGDPPNGTGIVRRSMSKKLMSGGYGNRIQDTFRLIPDTPMLLINDIFGEERRSRFDKKIRHLKHILETVITKDNSCKYRSIFQNIVSAKPVNEHNFLNATPLSIVLKFVYTIVGKLFPLEIWGSIKNKGVVFKNISNYLKTNLNCRPNLEHMRRGIKTKEISWMSGDKVASKQGHIIKISILLQFLSWFFEKFICKLVRLFWYVIEVPNGSSGKNTGSSLLFFSYDVWKKMSNGWLDDYTKKFLVPSHTPVNNVISMVTARNHSFGTIRLIPKAKGFRVLCVPYKSSRGIENRSVKEYKEERFLYSDYLNKKIRPLREILMYKLRCHRPLESNRNINCTSIREVCHELKKYKIRITHANGFLPKLFAIKFDMESCYDNLNQHKIVECIETLFSNDFDHVQYFVRNFQEYDKSNFNSKRQRFSINTGNSIANFNPMVYESSRKNNVVLIDKANTTKYSKDEILDLCKSQIFDSYIHLPQREWKWFKRIKGVFQGHPLSATLCEIVYNRIVNEYFQFLQDDSIFLRLADDFLVVSTDQNTCKRVFDVANGSKFKEYGAYINHGKTTFTDSADFIEETDVFNFVGLKLNIKTLEMSMLEDVHLPTVLISDFTSLEKLHSFLKRWYLMKLNEDSLDLTFSPIEAILDQIDRILKVVCSAIAKIYVKLSHFNASLSDPKLKFFILSLLESTIDRYQNVNQTFTYTENIIKHFVSSSKNYLMKSSSLKGSMTWLDRI